MAILGDARGSRVGWQRRWVRALVFAFALLAAFSAGALAESSAIGGGGRLPVKSDTAASGPFTICEDQTYALCAVSACFVFNEVAYCNCDVEHGDSLSLTDDYAPGQDVCTANAEGVTNGYMISTYSLPSSVLSPDGDVGLYTCPAKTSNGAYAQCDGAFCFRSSQGQSFPGYPEPLEDDEIICTCPITVADPETAKIGYQIAGPFPCQESFFENCKDPPAGKKTGDAIYVGAPTGVPRLLTKLLYGSVPPLNICLPSPGAE